jgi:hypothetical protein
MQNRSRGAACAPRARTAKAYFSYLSYLTYLSYLPIFAITHYPLPNPHLSLFSFPSLPFLLLPRSPSSPSSLPLSLSVYFLIIFPFLSFRSFLDLKSSWLLSVL